MQELSEGIMLGAIYGAGENPIQYRQGHNNVFQIVIVMQHGQIAGVPWARVEFDDGHPDVLVNLAHVESVELEEETEA